MRSARVALVAVCVLAAVVGSGCGRGGRTGWATSTPTSTRPNPAAAFGPVPTGSSTHTITVDGRQRSFRIYRPATVPSAAALVVMFHGALGTGEQAESAYGWDAEADRGGFVVAYPDGLHRGWVVSDGCCGPGVRTGVNDVAFITQLVGVISRAMPIEQARIYATGISNGGMLAYRLACDTTIFAAIGPDSATQLGSCPYPAPTSVIHIHGTADHTVPYTGGPGKLDNGGQGRSPADTSGPPIPDLIAHWRDIDQCATPSIDQAPPVTTSTATCAGGRAVELVSIDGAGHQWPGGAQPTHQLLRLDPPSRALNATDTLWRFFDTHPRP
jgi:polyhydroxybutyrate depolymerase